MTSQRWWSARDLKRIRRGIDVGRYHASFPYGRLYYEVKFLMQSRELTLYERGLVAGFESESRSHAFSRYLESHSSGSF